MTALRRYVFLCPLESMLIDTQSHEILACLYNRDSPQPYLPELIFFLGKILQIISAIKDNIISKYNFRKAV